MKRNILFLCPHGAAKSVMAAAYFQQLADQRGLNLQANAAGTEPDAQISPLVAALLKAEGIDVSGQPPRRVADAELAEADYIVSLGCELADLNVAEARVIRWDDVPPPGQDLNIARDAILVHIEQLMSTLRT
jgi:arsenate reductase (thioredoxin)